MELRFSLGNRKRVVLARPKLSSSPSKGNYRRNACEWRPGGGEVLALCADCFDDIVCDAPFFLLSSSSASRIFIFNFFLNGDGRLSISLTTANSWATTLVRMATADFGVSSHTLG
jgi:hypothetical protein